MLKALRWAAAAAATGVVAAHANPAPAPTDPPAPAAAQNYNQPSPALQMSVTPSSPSDGPAGVNGTASLALDIPHTQTTLTSGFAGGNQDSASDPGDASQPVSWGKGSVGIKSTMNGPGTLKFEIDANEAYHDSAEEGMAALAAGVSSDNMNEQQQTVQFTATQSPASDLDVKLGVQAQHATTIDMRTAIGTPILSRTAMNLDDQKAFVDTTFHPLTAITLEAGATLENIEATWRGVSGAADTYRYFEPQAGATAKLWKDASLKADIGEKVQPLNTADFEVLASTPDATADYHLAPDRQVQAQTTFTQKLGQALSFTASYVQGWIQSATELMPFANGVQAPASVASGTRQEVDMSLNLSLAALGLPHTTLEAQTAWRESSILDPLTQQSHRLSGEIPREASFRISRTLQDMPLKWGLTGHLSTEQTIYQGGETSQIDCGSSLGAFAEFNPGPYAIQIGVDGIAGNNRSERDNFYEGGTRASGQIADSVLTNYSGPAISLSLHKSF